MDAKAALGVVRAFRRESEVAARSLQRALLPDPMHVDLIERFASVLQDLVKLEDAGIAFEQLLRTHPGRRTTWALRATWAPPTWTTPLPTER